VRDDDHGIKQIAGGEREQRQRADAHELLEQQRRGDQIDEEQRCFIARDEGWHPRQRHAHERHGNRERDKRRHRDRDGVASARKGRSFAALATVSEPVRTADGSGRHNGSELASFEMRA
jgi:hypothetical protein